MYGTAYIFSKPFFTGWVSVGIIWIFCSFIAVGLFPVFEGRKTLVRTAKYIYLDLTGSRSFKTGGTTVHEAEGSAASGQVTPKVEEKGE